MSPSFDPFDQPAERRVVEAGEDPERIRALDHPPPDRLGDLLRHQEQLVRVGPRASASLRMHSSLGYTPYAKSSGRSFSHVNDAVAFRSCIRRMSWTVRIVAYSAMGLAAMLPTWQVIWLLR